MSKKVRIYITLKPAVLDTQGKAIENSLTRNLGFENISNVRQGKLIELQIDEDSEDKIKNKVKDMCDKLLVNDIIENFEFDVVA